MTQTSARLFATLLTHHAARCLPARRAAWADPMRHEVDSIEDDKAALRWAAGCVVATYSERINPMSNAAISPFLGLVALFVFVFGGYLLHGGHMIPIVEALPTEVIVVVLGAAAAASIRTAAGGPGIFRSIGLSLRGRLFHKADYRDLAAGLLQVFAAAKPPLNRNRAFLTDEAAARMIHDAQALTEQNQLSADQIASVLQSRIAAIAVAQQRGVQVLRAFSRSLLWFSCIAALLGFIHSGGAVTEPPEVIGGMIGSSMVGWFVGVFVAAGIVQPLANRLEAVVSDDANFYNFIRTAFFCRRAGSDAALAVRTACGALPPDLALSQGDLDSLPDVALENGRHG